ncbi:phosphopantetheine-binding protein [Streptomyces sp. NPDC001348]
MATEAAVHGTDELTTDELATDELATDELATDELTTEELTALVHHAWAEALGHDEFTDEDHFFQVGGHSMGAVQVVRRIGAALGRRLPVRLLLRNPTVRGLAAALAAPAADATAGSGEAGA